MRNFTANTEKHKLKQRDAIFQPLECKKLISLTPLSVAMNSWRQDLQPSRAGVQIGVEASDSNLSILNNDDNGYHLEHARHG